MDRIVLNIGFIKQLQERIMDNQLLQEYDKIYKLYGYQSADVDGIRVYEYKHGRYFGADIIALSTDREKTVNKVELEYKQLGFATTVKHYSPIQELEIDLFKSFFHVDTLRRSIKKDTQISLRNNCWGYQIRPNTSILTVLILRFYITVVVLLMSMKSTTYLWLIRLSIRLRQRMALYLPLLKLLPDMAKPALLTKSLIAYAG